MKQLLLVLLVRTAAINKSVYLFMVCPFAGQTVIVLRTVSKIKPKQSSSPSPSSHKKKSQTLSHRNLLSRIIKKNEMKETQSEDRIRVEKYRGHTTFEAHYNTITGFSTSKRRTRTFYYVNGSLCLSKQSDNQQ